MTGHTFVLLANIIIVISCYTVYRRTRQLYNLSMQKGLLYFSNAFLVYILSFSARLAYLLLEDFYPQAGLIFVMRAISLLGGALGGFYLAYSLVWRRFEKDQFHHKSHVIIIWLAILVTTADLFLAIGFGARTAYVLFLTMIVVLLTVLTLKKGRSRNPYVSSVGLGFAVYISLFLADLFSPILGTIEYYVWGLVTIFFVAVAHNVSGCCK